MTGNEININTHKENNGQHLNSSLGQGDSNMFYGAIPILFEFAKDLRNNPTEAESYLWNFLCGNKILNVRFKRQHPIFYFVADFYCHQAKLIIEVDGGYHKIPGQYEYDINRDVELEQFGLKVLRFTNERVFTDTERVIEEITQEVEIRISQKGSKK